MLQQSESNSICNDGIDNDGDGDIDLADTGCSSAIDPVEGANPQCSDGLENDADSNTDFPANAGFTSVFDNNEAL